ncbi:MAG: hypothetical protein JW952_00620 [Candidatus Eisenbacteria bacterium]|nr:hypothetical protein [Candidatus Eisenbacteria bacterium]
MVASVILLVCLATPDASAGRIFGDIKMDGKPVPAGLKVTIALAAPADHREFSPVHSDHSQAQVIPVVSRPGVKSSSLRQPVDGRGAT